MVVVAVIVVVIGVGVLVMVNTACVFGLKERRVEGVRGRIAGGWGGGSSP